VFSSSVIRGRSVTNYTGGVQHVTDGAWNHLQMQKPATSPLDRFSKNLKTLIALHEMTVAQVAEKARVIPKQVYNLLNGSHDPRLKGLEKVANVFGLSAWQMLAIDLEGKPAEIKQVLRLLELFTATDESGRKTIMQVAEIAASVPSNRS
jgi:transcriptional regulator with XRE-family HTH domain